MNEALPRPQAEYQVDDRADPRAFLKTIDPEPFYAVVGFADIGFEQRFGTKILSTTENRLDRSVVGTVQRYVADTLAPKHKIGDDVQIRARGQGVESFGYGRVVGNSTLFSPALLEIALNDVAGVEGIFRDHEIQVVARPQEWMEHDVSQTGFNPTLAGPFDIQVRAGLMFLIQGTVIVRSILKPGVVVFGKIEAYTGTTLRFSKIATNATVSETLSAWDVGLIDVLRIEQQVPFNLITGLRVTRDSGDPQHDIRIEAGATPDSTGSVMLTLASPLVKRLDAVFAPGTNQGAAVLTADFAGTGTSAATSPPLYTITGTGTAYTTNFADTCGLSDWDARADDPSYLLFSNSTRLAIFSHSDDAYATSRIADPDTPTSLLTVTTVNPLMTSATIRRGGVITPSLELGTLGIVLAQNDTTGVCDVCSVSLTPSGAPDLPAGYTRYAVLALVAIPSGGTGNIARIKNSRGEAWKVIESGSINTGATKTIFLPAGFSAMKLTWDNISMDTATRRVLVRASTDGGATFNTTVLDYNGSVLNDSTGVLNNIGVASFTSNADQTAAQTCDGYVIIDGYDAEGWKPFRTRSRSDGVGVLSTLGHFNSDDPITHLQVLPSGTGNFDGAGTYKLVGIR